jgi:hypothetical protein
MSGERGVAAIAFAMKSNLPESEDIRMSEGVVLVYRKAREDSFEGQCNHETA